jgi:hypothetical protein
MNEWWRALARSVVESFVKALPQKSFEIDSTDSSPQSGKMFIATRLLTSHSAKSEMLSISLFAEEEREGCAVSINITCLRHVPVRITH